MLLSPRFSGYQSVRMAMAKKRRPAPVDDCAQLAEAMAALRSWMRRLSPEG